MSGIRETIITAFPGAKEVSAWTLTGNKNLSITVLTFGGIVQKILVPDKEGRLVDVVLGFKNPADYSGPHPFFGATAGRIAGRVTRGDLTIGETKYPLPINDPPHHLHGGIASIDRQVWQATPLSREDGAPSLKLTLTSEDGENGYPGKIELSVIYTITNDNCFVFETEARSDRPTPVSLTHHSYFNLAGEGAAPTDDHELQIPGDSAFEADEWMGLTGECHKVEGRPNDARSARPVGEFRKGLWKEHGDLYWLGESKRVRPAARLRDPLSGRILEVATDCTCVQFYSGIGLDSSLIGKSGFPYPSGAGVCLECEGYPNAFDEDKRFGSIMVEPDLPQRTRTEYRFTNQSTSLISS